MTASPEMLHFWLLTRDQQAQAMRRMLAAGWSDHGIAAATRLSVEQVRQLLSEADATATRPSPIAPRPLGVPAASSPPSSSR